jgi:tetratricopeptide (TPR) repeat protein
MGVVALVTAAAFALRKRWPALLAAWFCYGVLVSPILGILQSGAQKVADRYAQLGSIPLVILAVGGLLVALERRLGERGARMPQALFAGTAVFALGLGFVTRRQVTVWSSSESLFRRAVEVEPDNYFVLHNYAVMLYRRQAWSEAIEIEQRSVAAHPGRGNELARHTLGILHQMQGRADLAEAAWRSAVEWEPEPGDPRYSDRPKFWLPDPADCLASLRSPLAARGAQAELIALYEKGIERRPDVQRIYVDLDALLAQAGRHADRVTLWEKAEKQASIPRAIIAGGQARALISVGRLRDAEPLAFRAAALDRVMAQEVLDMLSAAVWRSGLPAALEMFERARRAGVPGPMVENGIGKAYLAANRLSEAEPYLLRAQALDSLSRAYVVDVCELFLRQGRRDDAVSNLRALLNVDPQNARAQALLQQATGAR